MSKQTESPVIQLLYVVWAHANKGIGHSWERLNRSMYHAMRLAIQSGMEFDRADFAEAAKRFRGGYWLRTEDCYSLAVGVGNTSAAKSIEASHGWEPIIADDVDAPTCYGHLPSTTRQRDRLAVGSRLTWRGHLVEVTSCVINNRGQYVNACLYEQKPDGRKVVKRFRIDRAAVVADRKERKAKHASE